MRYGLKITGLKEFAWAMFWLTLIVLFWGEPDLHDAIIERIKR